MTYLELERYRILIIEDEFFTAAKLGYELAELGASILGPASSMRDALVLMVQQGRPDGAILDIGLGGIPIFPLADILIDCEVPIIFMAHHQPMIMPARFAHVPIYQKPVTMAHIAPVLHETIERWRAYA